MEENKTLRLLLMVLGASAVLCGAVYAFVGCDGGEHPSKMVEMRKQQEQQQAQMRAGGGNPYANMKGPGAPGASSNPASTGQ